MKYFKLEINKTKQWRYLLNTENAANIHKLVASKKVLFLFKKEITETEENE